MTDKTISMLKMSDPTESKRIHKEHLFDLPMKTLIVGKSQLSGKTNAIGNLVLRPFNESDKGGEEFYRDDFEGKNIYVVCPSIHLDPKWEVMIKSKQIPSDNIFTEYNEEDLEQLYDGIERRHLERQKYGDPPVHTLLILDDIAFSGKLKDKLSGTISRIFCNGRQCLLSVIATAQKYSQVSTTARENATGLLLYECSNKQLDLLAEDHAIIPKKDFHKMFREATKEKHSFLVVNYTNERDDRYQDSNFKSLMT